MPSARAGKCRLTLDELDRAVVDLVGAWQAIGDAAFQDMWPRWRQASAGCPPGVLCFGPNKGRRVNLYHPRRWLPGFRPARRTKRSAR